MHRVRLSGWWRVPGTEEGSKHVRVSRWDRTECYEILLSPTCLDKTIVSFRDHIEVTCGVPVYYQRIFVETVEITRLASNKTLKEVADLADRAQSETLSIELYDLRYLEQALHSRLEKAVDIVKLVTDPDPTECCVLSHRPGCRVFGCSTTACVKAGPALHIYPSGRRAAELQGGGGQSRRRYQAMLSKLVHIYRSGLNFCGMDVVSERIPYVLVNSCSREDGSVCVNPAHVQIKVPDSSKLNQRPSGSVEPTDTTYYSRSPKSFDLGPNLQPRQTEWKRLKVYPRDVRKESINSGTRKVTENIQLSGDRPDAPSSVCRTSNVGAMSLPELGEDEVVSWLQDTLHRSPRKRKAEFAVNR